MTEVKVHRPTRALPDAFWILILILCALGRGSAVSICFPNSSGFVFLVFFLTLIAYLYTNRGRIPLKQIRNNPSALVMILLFLPSIVINMKNNSLSNDLLLILTILSAHFITLQHQREKLFELFLSTMYFLCIISLICFFLFAVLHVPYNWMPSMTKVSDLRESYKTLLLYSIRLNDAERNCGPFWEPSIFAAYSCLALVLQLFAVHKPNKRRVVVFLLSIISTFSTGGIILLTLTVLLWSWQNRKGNIYSIILTTIAAFSIALFLDLFIDWLLRIDYNLFSKLFLFTSSKSSMSRVYSILANIEIWKTSPFFGVGQVQVDTIYHSTSATTLAISLLQLRPSQSATPFIFLAAFGLSGIYYSILWIKAIVKFRPLNIVQRTVFGAMVFFILTETPHTGFMLTFYLLFALLHKDCTMEAVQH